MGFIGFPLGILIGVISGFALLLLLKSAMRTSAGDVKGLLLILAELLAIPTFWFGGPWLTTTLMADIDRNALLGPYLVGLAVAFVLIAALPLARLIIRIGNDIAVTEGEP